MICSRRLTPGPVLPLAAAAMMLCLLAGIAACLVCDFDRCCQDSDHGDESPCACACAMQSTPGMTTPSLSIFAPIGFETPSSPAQVQSIHLHSLFRPPRA